MQPGCKVTLKPKDFQHRKGRVGRVIEHLAEDPRIVTVFIAADQENSGSGSDWGRIDAETYCHTGHTNHASHANHMCHSCPSCLDPANRKILIRLTGDSESR